jgi:hypothetical protein
MGWKKQLLIGFGLVVIAVVITIVVLEITDQTYWFHDDTRAKTVLELEKGSWSLTHSLSGDTVGAHPTLTELKPFIIGDDVLNNEWFFEKIGFADFNIRSSAPAITPVYMTRQKMDGVDVVVATILLGTGGSQDQKWRVIATTEDSDETGFLITSPNGKSALVAGEPVTLLDGIVPLTTSATKASDVWVLNTIIASSTKTGT